MPRKEKINYDMLMEGAFKLLRQEGEVSISARKLAEAVGCSTQPIFRVFKNIDDLKLHLLEKTIKFYYDFSNAENTRIDESSLDIPFIRLGMNYINFAFEEPMLFGYLFLNMDPNSKSLYEIVNGPDGLISKEIARAQEMGCHHPQQLFMNLWIMIHGIASMTITGNYDLTIEQTKAFLVQNYHIFSQI